MSLHNEIQALRETLPNPDATVGSNERYYKKSANGGRTPIVAIVNMTLNVYVSKDQRLAFASLLVGRTIGSTKELTLAECVAINKSLPQKLKVLAESL